MTTSTQDDPARRVARYQSLTARNRGVGILRVAVPALGVLVLLAMIGQIYLSSLASRFGIENISITPERILVDAPQYSGLLADGSAYRVWAENAEAATAAPDQIHLRNAGFSLVRGNGVTMQANAAEAVLDTTEQRVLVEGEAQVEDSAGISGTMLDSIIDLQAQTITSEGPVSIDYPDGTTLRAKGLHYDTQNLIWTFTGSTVTLPATPGAKPLEISSP
jgi:hypothetical protein